MALSNLWNFISSVSLHVLHVTFCLNGGSELGACCMLGMHIAERARLCFLRARVASQCHTFHSQAVVLLTGKQSDGNQFCSPLEHIS